MLVDTTGILFFRATPMRELPRNAYITLAAREYAVLSTFSLHNFVEEAQYGKINCPYIYMYAATQTEWQLYFIAIVALIFPFNH